MERIYHRYEKWECFKAGIFNNASGKEKELMVQKIIEMFSHKKLTEKYMNRVISLWPHSVEHNLTNTTMNRVAWLGQAACCLYCGAPHTVTMETWNKIDKKHRDIADQIAKKIITRYETIDSRQTCLKLLWE